MAAAFGSSSAAWYTCWTLPSSAALNRTFLNVVELTVRAALDGNVQHVYQAALLDPNAAATLTTSQIIEMCDDLLDAHKALLPPGLAR